MSFPNVAMRRPVDDGVADGSVGLPGFEAGGAPSRRLCGEIPLQIQIITGQA
ncbi:hypothetical protein [Paraburkholderia humisilvae]|uniref:hypothetical protein n=1 Tax=Paraburkholderia humisilvae TaxID=627669 RepID=UPI0035ECAA72